VIFLYACKTKNLPVLRDNLPHYKQLPSSLNVVPAL
jgi:hypothetical protein